MTRRQNKLDRSFQHALVALTLLVSTAALGQSAHNGGEDVLEEIRSRGMPFVDAVRVTDGPEIDGVLDEAAWAEAAVLSDFRQVLPDEGEPGSERTEVLVAYDADFLYLGFRCFDSDPAGIIATEMRRDGRQSSDDRVSVIIDPFFDRRNAYHFEINAAGARTDGLVEDNRRLRRDWDGIWYGRASVTDTGWVAEVAIPFKTLSFDPDSSRWSLNIARVIRRKNETVRWASPTVNKSFTSVADAGVLEALHDLRQGRGLDIKPYGLSTLKRDHRDDRNGLDVDAGLDLFYKMTPSLTLSATFNTDFAETEVDERRVNLTRFPLFFPEKRDFFLQDAGIFNFGGINRNPLPFHSRRIGLGPGGKTLDILAGLKVTGRVGGLNLGLLDVQMKHDDELGNKNHFVGRASMNVLEESTVGIFTTFGDPGARGDSWLVGVDFNFRDSSFAGTDKTVFSHVWAMQSKGTEERDGGSSAFGFKLGYPNDRLSWDIGVGQIDEDFEAALGFVPRRGIREFFGNIRHRWRPDHDVIRSIDISTRGFINTNLDNEVESRHWSIELLRLQTHDGDELEIGIEREREVLDEPFEISEGVVLARGDYKFDRFGCALETSSARPVILGLSYVGGEFYTGTRDEYGASVTWRVSRHLNLGGEYELNDVELDEGSFTTRLLRGRVNVFFTPDISWSTFAQYDNLSESIGLNSRLRWIIEPGNEVFVVLNQSVQREDDSFRVEQTELTTKVGWTFRF